VPFLMFSRKWWSYRPQCRERGVLHPRQRTVIGSGYTSGSFENSGSFESAATVGCFTAGVDCGAGEDDGASSM